MTLFFYTKMHEPLVTDARKVSNKQEQMTNQIHIILEPSWCLFPVVNIEVVPVPWHHKIQSIHVLERKQIGA